VKKEGCVAVRWPRHPLATYHCGNYVFLNFPRFSLFQWHPFTLSSGPNDPWCEVHIKSLGDFTNKLHDSLQVDNPRLWVRCDGPYGKFTIDYHHYDTVLLVGGGVGVTPCIACLRDIYRVSMSASARMGMARIGVIRSVFFLWVCPNSTVYSWFQDVVEGCVKKSKVEGYPTFHPLVYSTREKEPKDPLLIPGRPDMYEVFGQVEDDARTREARRIAVFTCGPTPLVNQAWDESIARSGGDMRFEFHNEIFDF